MKSFFTTENIILMSLFAVGVASIGVAIKVGFFLYIGLTCITVGFAWLGYNCLLRYNKDKKEFEERKSQSIETLSQNFDEAYAKSVLDTSEMDSDFKRQHIKYKLFGIGCIIFAISFAYIMISDIFK